MKRVVLAVVLLSSVGFAGALRAQAGATPGAQAALVAAPGTADAGRAYWTTNRSQCRNCHGANGEGGFGPNLAGRGLSADEFKRAVRTPWGVMPAYTEQQASDQDIAGLTAYFASLPKTEPGPWQTPLPANAPTGQQLLIAGAGCGQCHGPEIANARADGGGIAADYAWFAKEVYDHTSVSPNGRMGNFSRARLPESTLQEIWHYASVDLGLRPLIRTQVSQGTPAGTNTSYTVTVTNAGTAGKGLTAEDVSVWLALPAGTTVASASPEGYQGVKHDAQANADAAVWSAAKLAPGESLTCTIALVNAAAPPRGQVRWTRPKNDMAAFAGRGAGPGGPAAGGAGRGGRGQ